MKKLLFIIIALLSFSNLASASSLDELYRDLIKSDNEGYLPMFVKNRHTPDVLLDDKLPASENLQPAPVQVTTEPSSVSFINEEQRKEEALKAAQQKWENAVLAVKENRVTPVELEEIIQQANLNNPKAVEIYAWMNTKGAGIQKNLIKAFELYQKAYLLGIPNAEKNAALIYRVLTPDQRATLGKAKL